MYEMSMNIDTKLQITIYEMKKWIDYSVLILNLIHKYLFMRGNVMPTLLCTVNMQRSLLYRADVVHSNGFGNWERSWIDFLVFEFDNNWSFNKNINECLAFDLQRYHAEQDDSMTRRILRGTDYKSKCIFSPIETHWFIFFVDFVTELLMHCAIQCLNKMRSVCLNLVVVAIIRACYEDQKQGIIIEQHNAQCKAFSIWIDCLFYVLSSHKSFARNRCVEFSTYMVSVVIMQCLSM